MNIAVKDCTFSDHKAVFLQIGRFNHKKERIQVRRWLFDHDVFAFACSTKPSLSPNVSLEDNARVFTEWLSSVSDRATSFKWSVKRDPSKFKPWYTDDLKRLKQITLNCTDAVSKKIARNRYVAELRKAKRKFVRAQVEDSNVWKIINRNK